LPTVILACAGVADIALAQTSAPPAVTVSAPPQREIVEWDEFTGQFAAIGFVEIRARVNGYLTEIHFQDAATRDGALLRLAND
jgi:multidrug efflux pump subunit AcrA (membrane-fusion protein)